MRIRVGCEFRFDAALPVPAVVLLRARSDGGVTVESETWHVQPYRVIDINAGKFCSGHIVRLASLAPGFRSEPSAENWPRSP